MTDKQSTEKQCTDKEKLVNVIAEKTKMTKVSSIELINTFRDVLIELIEKAGENGYRMDGFGTFQIKKRSERQGRNPKTGEPIKISARRNITFKPSKAFKDSVNK